MVGVSLEYWDPLNMERYELFNVYISKFFKHELFNSSRLASDVSETLQIKTWTTDDKREHYLY